MGALLVFLLCLRCLQVLVAAPQDAGQHHSLLHDLRAALAVSPPKVPLPRVRADTADQDVWPKGLLLGAGVSALQSEGASLEDGKGESMMDFAVNFPGLFSDNVSVAADHYHRFREDLDLAKEMKFTSHRFSIAWSRVLPTGGVDNINEKGVQFYKDYIDKVISNNMEPMVTMLHFDQPILVDNTTGGWGHSGMIDRYVDYAEFLFRTFGDKVKYWNTINEPNIYCNYFRTLLGDLDPVQEGDQYYKCMHNIAVAHAKTYHLYKQKYEAKQKGKVGISVVVWPSSPKTTQSEDVMASEIFNQLYVGTLIHPVIFGDYPPVLRYLVDKADAENGLSESRLPAFTPEEKKLLAGGVTDYIAVNVYSRCTASYNRNKTSGAEQSILLGPVMKDMPFVEVTGVGNFDVTEESLMQDALLWIWRTYHVPIIITENGYGDQKHVGVKDTVRAAFHSANLRSLVRTMKEYDVEVLAYYVWSLLDVFEFSAGYTGRPFGLIHVDYESGTLKRTLKDSSKFFIDLATSGRVPYVSVPDERGTSTGSTSAIASGLLLSAVWVTTWLRSSTAS
ncbi:myrosinase 1-like [Frankliniella occidentalis]|uniref:Myrosinase 1-like n=1 Tax=Frankliniella occidentalis TaxID=133901 RepID=A0A9C6U0G6_FRAOC|nr:myrosinase 1-like [Frankliniella occidentalis]